MGNLKYPRLNIGRPINIMQNNVITTSIHQPSKKLVDAKTCISIIFPIQESAPSIRTWWKWKSNRWIPYVKLGKCVFFDPTEVRKAIDKRFTIKAIEG